MSHNLKLSNIYQGIGARGKLYCVSTCTYVMNHRDVQATPFRAAQSLCRSNWMKSDFVGSSNDESLQHMNSSKEENDN